MSEIATNLSAIQDRIAEAATSVNRKPEEITLIAVSKTVPLEGLFQAYEAGQRHFGESRLQEALPKIQAMPEDCVWHFIGPLQSNKAKAIGNLFHIIHTVYNERQLKEIEKCSRQVDVFIEVNIGEEEQKAGILLKDIDDFYQSLIHCKQATFRGLMTIGPRVESSEESRRFFRALKEQNARLGGTCISMGMSGDFDVAIQEGATHVRVGSAIFGSR